MVARWGMSEEIGPVAIADGAQDGFPLGGAPHASPATQQRVDEEARRIIDEAEEEVTSVLERERHRLDVLARALLERETLDQADAYRLAGVEIPALDAEHEAKAGAQP
jgi:cell division protease FtsH